MSRVTVGVGVMAATFFMLPAESWRSYLGVGDQYFRAIQDSASVPNLPTPQHTGPVEGYIFGTDSLTNIEIEPVRRAGTARCTKSPSACRWSIWR